jgi:hypothetical protein
VVQKDYKIPTGMPKGGPERQQKTTGRQKNAYHTKMTQKDTEFLPRYRNVVQGDCRKTTGRQECLLYNDGTERNRIPNEIPEGGSERQQKNYMKAKEYIPYKDDAERHRIPTKIPKRGPERLQKNYRKTKECMSYRMAQ